MKSNEKILITGASGLVGGRLCEILHLTKQFKFRAMVHNPGNAARIARLPIEIVVADLLDKKAVFKAAEGCSYIVHLARDGQPVMIKGLKNLLKAAKHYNIKKFIHISSVAVYGDDPPAQSEFESCLPDPGDNSYGRIKLEQEKIIMKYLKKGVPSIILRPPNIYGPFSAYSTIMINKIINGKMALVDKGENPCNVVFVDNLIEAIILAIKCENGIGEAFFITDREKISWKDYIEAYLNILNNNYQIPNISSSVLSDEAKSTRENIYLKHTIASLKFLISGEFRKCISSIPIFRKINEILSNWFNGLNPNIQSYIRDKLSSPILLSNEKTNMYLNDIFISVQNRKVRHSIEKAQKILGYSPRFSLNDAMNMTKGWLAKARYIDSK